MPTILGVGGLREPVPYLLKKVLRGAVHEHAALVREQPERRRTRTLHVGVPGGRRRQIDLRQEDRWDHALRVEAIEAMCRGPLSRDVVPLVWLTRPPAEPGDTDDQVWVAAVATAAAELGVRLDLVVVTRLGWADPRTGVGRTWARIRPTTAPRG